MPSIHRILLLLTLTFPLVLGAGCSHDISVASITRVPFDRQLITDLAPSEDIWACVFTPDSKYLLAGNFPVWKAVTKIRQFDVKTGNLVREFEGPIPPIEGLAISQDMKLIASCGGTSQIPGQDSDNYVQIWDFATGKELQRIGSPLDIERVSFAPDGKLLAYADIRWKIVLRNIETGESIVVAPGISQGIEGDNIQLFFSPDGRYLCSSFAQWPVLGTSPPAVGKMVNVPAQAISPNGTRAYAAGATHTAADALEWYLIPTKAHILEAAFPSGKVERIWRLDCFGSGSVSFNDMALSSDGTLLALASTQGPFLLNVAQGKTPPVLWEGTMPPPGMAAHCVALSPDGKHLAVGSFGLFLWDHLPGQ